MTSQHMFRMHLEWEPNSSNNDSKNYKLQGIGDKPYIMASSAAAFQGDENRYNPEELLVGALASCHMLWFLYLAKLAQITVIDYKDEPEGILELQGSNGRFTEITLTPKITILEEDKIEEAKHLQEKAHQKCYIANSVNFDVKLNPHIIVKHKAA
ncbi:MAG: OsmC family protein [Alphaproteobacteria bacterium]|nr:OsmC family protein [Alphaproteobacteria bacterium]